ncbi:MAG: hypothetical protein RI898_842, partial [Actinomycetota bacterium]
MSRRPRLTPPHSDVDVAEWATLIASRSDEGAVDPNT